jgi:hypothetical protein
MKTDWKLILACYSPYQPITFFDQEGVEITKKVLDDIYNQLKSMINNRNVFLIPSSEDDEKFHKTADKHDGHRGHHHDDYIIGNIINIQKNIKNYISPTTDHIYAKVSIDKKFNWLPLRSYGLHIGLNYKFTTFEEYGNPYNYYLVEKKNFVIKSCKVKGLYFKQLYNPNKENKDSLQDYYRLRSLSMLIYLPGVSYY